MAVNTRRLRAEDPSSVQTAAVDTTPTWALVLDAARNLHARMGEFTLDDLIRQVQRTDASRGRGTIQPTVQGMTVNAGTGPPSPCGKPLRRVRRGYYTLEESAW